MDIKIRPAPLSDCDAAETFLQSGFWASFKSAFGWTPLPFIVSRQGQADFSLLVMIRGIKAGLKFAYVPHGPALDSAADDAGRTELLAALSRALKPYLPKGTLFLRFDPPWYRVESAEFEEAERACVAAAQAEVQASKKPAAQAPASSRTSASSLEGSVGTAPGGSAVAPNGALIFPPVERPGYGAPLRRAAADVQPPDTVLLDISRPEEDILAGMKPKWRYNIRLAEKKGVIVTEARALPDCADGDSSQSGADGAAWRPALSQFYTLYRETSARDHIALHPESYYAKLFETAASYKTVQTGSAGSRAAGPNEGARPDIRVWTASHEGDILASIITVFWGKQGVYLYGASCSLKRNLMPAYALQWAAVRAAKMAGCVEYDFYGMPPTADPRHPMAGLYLFKTGFGGRNIHRGGSWDYPLNTQLYGAFRAAERVRSWYYKDFRKRK